MSAADRCAQELRASDTRWEALRLAEFNFRTLSSVLPDVVANARRALTTFDISRTTEDGKQALLARSESAVAAVAESDRRLTALADALRGWRGHASANALAHVLELMVAITQPDRRRATGDAAAEVLEALVVKRQPPAISINEMVEVARLPWGEQTGRVFGCRWSIEDHQR
jgi:hypothetical protein